MLIKQVETHIDCKQMLKHTHTGASNIWSLQECACSCVCVIILGFSGGWREHLFTLTRIFLFCILHSCLLMVSTNRAAHSLTHTHPHVKPQAFLNQASLLAKRKKKDCPIFCKSSWQNASAHTRIILTRARCACTRTHPVIFGGLLFWYSTSSTVHTAPFTFSTRTKHLCRLRLWRTAFWEKRTNMTVSQQD